MVKKTKSESQIQKEIMRELPSTGCVIFRNNTGVCRDGGRFVRYGLCKGGSDLIGWTPTVITPAMVGKTVAIFSAVEVKKDGGKMSEEQLYFVGRVLGDGGYAGSATSVDEAKRIVGG